MARGRQPCSRPPEMNEGARDAQGPGGPTGLDASRHRGLPFSFALLPAKAQGATAGRATEDCLFRKSAKPKASRARCFEVCSAWSPVVGHSSGRSRPSSGPPGLHRSGPGHSGAETLLTSVRRPIRPSAGCGRCVARRDRCGYGPPGLRTDIADAQSFSGHRSPRPHLKLLFRHPFVGAMLVLSRHYPLTGIMVRSAESASRTMRSPDPRNATHACPQDEARPMLEQALVFNGDHHPTSVEWMRCSTPPPRCARLVSLLSAPR